MNREELEAKAKELGITFDDKTTDEDLGKAIKDKEVKDPTERLSYLEEELRKVIKQRDSLKTDKRTVSAKLKTFEEKISALPDSDKIEEMMTELKGLRTFKTTTEEEVEKKRLENMDEHDRKIAQLKKTGDEEKKTLKDQMEELMGKMNEKDTALEEAKSRIASLRVSELEKGILEHASKYKAIKPGQIARLLKDDFQYDDTTGKYVSFTRDGKGKIVDELSIEEKVKVFLEDPDNDNLVEGNVVPGTSHKDSSTTTTTTTKSGSKYNPNNEDIKMLAEEKGLKVEDYIYTLELRDTKLNKK